MGIDRGVYIGPHITIEKVSSTFEEETFLGCVNEECPEFEKKSQSNFCSNCGKEIGGYIVETESNMNIYDIMDELNIDPDIYAIHNLLDLEYDILLLPNRDIGCQTTIFLDSDLEIFQDLSNIDSDSELEIFKNNKENKELMEYFDNNDIQYSVDFTLIQYFF